MAQSDSRSDGSRSVEQNNIGHTQVVNNHFHGNTYLSSERKGLYGITIAIGILMLISSPFTLAFPSFSITLAASGLILITGISDRIANVLGFRPTATIRNITLVVLLLLNLPFAIAFGKEKLRLREVLRSELVKEQQARYNEQQRKDSLNSCLLRIDSLYRNSETDKALIELDKADLLAMKSGEKADVNQIRIDVSLIKVTELMNRHQYNMAIELLSSLYELDSNDTEILYQRALCYAKTNRIADAVHDAKRAMFHGHAAADTLYEKINPIKQRLAYYTTQCRDGSFSSATGSGACSHHGGVATWKYPVYETYREYE
jgi:tetratricopeptide (TPR) repeat protein